MRTGLILAISLVATLILLSSIADAERTGLAISQLEVDIAPFAVPPITHGKEEYRINAGMVTPVASDHDTAEILRTARYVLLNQFDPILAITGTDPDILLRSIEALRQTTDNIASVYEESEEKRIIDTLYPLPFLEKLADLERARLVLLSNPNERAVVTYHRTLMATMDTYLKSADAFIESLRSPILGGHDDVFKFWGGATEYDTLTTKIDSLKSAIGARKRSAQSRYMCFHGYFEDCERVTEAFAKFSVRDRQPDVSHTNTQLATARKMQDILSKYYRATGAENGPRSETIISVNTSSCYPNESPTFYRRHEIRGDGRGTAVRYDILNDIFFYDTAGAHSQYLSRLRENGLEFVYQTGGNPYMCLDAGFDYALVSATAYIAERLKEIPPPSTMNEKMREGADALSRQESFLRDALILDPEDVQNYLEEWLTLVKGYGTARLGAWFGTPAVASRNDLVFAWNQGAPRFHEAVALLADSNAWMSADGIGRPDEFRATVLSRSYPSFLLLPFNASVTEDFRSFYSRTEDIAFKDFKMVRYTEDLENMYDETEILELMVKSRKVFDSLLQPLAP